MISIKRDGTNDRCHDPGYKTFRFDHVVGNAYLDHKQVLAVCETLIDKGFRNTAGSGHSSVRQSLKRFSTEQVAEILRFIYDNCASICLGWQWKLTSVEAFCGPDFLANLDTDDQKKACVVDQALALQWDTFFHVQHHKVIGYPVPVEPWNIKTIRDAQALCEWISATFRGQFEVEDCVDWVALLKQCMSFHGTGLAQWILDQKWVGFQHMRVDELREQAPDLFRPPQRVHGIRAAQIEADYKYESKTGADASTPGLFFLRVLRQGDETWDKQLWPKIHYFPRDSHHKSRGETWTLDPTLQAYCKDLQSKADEQELFERQRALVSDLVGSSDEWSGEEDVEPGSYSDLDE